MPILRIGTRNRINENRTRTMAKATKTRIDEDALEHLNEVAASIARLRWDNWDVIQQYHAVELKEEQIEYEARKQHGDFATHEALRKAVERELDNLQKQNAPRKKGGRLTTRITPQMKLDVIIDMLQQMNKRNVKELTLKQMNEWFSEPMGDQLDCRNMLGLCNTKILQVQWFDVKAGDKKISLYQKQHYVSKNAPHPSYFLVKPWLKWLKENEKKLSNTIATKQRRGS